MEQDYTSEGDTWNASASPQEAVGYQVFCFLSQRTLSVHSASVRTSFGALP